jgi:hypothetical protein
MDWKTAYLGLLKGLAQGYRIVYPGRSVALEKLIAGIESGKRLDAQMQRVADAVASDDPNNWDGPDGVIARINAHGDEFQKPAPVG